MASTALFDETHVTRMRAHTDAVIGVAVVDDQQMFLTAVAASLEVAPDICVTGMASDVAGAVDLIERSRPSVVVSDIQMGNESGLALLGHFPKGPPIVMLTSHDHAVYHQAALRLGAAGYVLKSDFIDRLVDVVRVVAAGQTAFPPEVERRGRRNRARLPSRRELDVIQLVAEGASNDEIAADLSISRKTVDSYLRCLFDRHGVSSRTELAMHAVAGGWLRPAIGGTRAGRDRWIIDEEIVPGRR